MQLAVGCQVDFPHLEIEDVRVGEHNFPTYKQYKSNFCIE